MAGGARAIAAAADPSVTITYQESVAPVVTLDAPPARVGAAPALAGRASAGGGDSTNVVVRIYAGQAATGTPARAVAATIDAGAYSAPTAGLPDGTWTAQAVQGDAAGNAGVSAARTFTLDTTAPAPALTSPGAGAFTRNPTQVFGGTAGTATGDAQVVTLQLFGGPSAAGTPVRLLTVPVAAGAFGVTAAPLGDGTYTLLARRTTTSATRARPRRTCSPSTPWRRP